MNISRNNNIHKNNHLNNNNNNSQACAACKYQRKKCALDCILAPYFPHDHQRQFLNAHKLFGVKKITRIIKHLEPHNKDEAMRSIIFQSDMRANDPVGGCYRYIQELQAQIKYHQAELELVLQQLAVFRPQQAHHHDHLNFYNYSPNDITPVLPPPTSHYQYLQHQQLPQQEPYMMFHPPQREHQINSDVSLQDDVSDCWASMQDSGSFSLQNKINGGDDNISGGYVGDELYNDQKSLSKSMLDPIQCDDDHERNEISFATQELVDHRSEEGVLFKIENEVLKAEADDCIEHDQDHDLKGAATLFTLTNCTT